MVHRQITCDALGCFLRGRVDHKCAVRENNNHLRSKRTDTDSIGTDTAYRNSFIALVVVPLQQGLRH